MHGYRRVRVAARVVRTRHARFLVSSIRTPRRDRVFEPTVIFSGQRQSADRPPPAAAARARARARTVGELKRERGDTRSIVNRTAVPHMCTLLSPSSVYRNKTSARPATLISQLLPRSPRARPSSARAPRKTEREREREKSVAAGVDAHSRENKTESRETGRTLLENVPGTRRGIRKRDNAGLNSAAAAENLLGKYTVHCAARQFDKLCVSTKPTSPYYDVSPSNLSLPLPSPHFFLPSDFIVGGRRARARDLSAKSKAPPAAR